MTRHSTAKQPNSAFDQHGLTLVEVMVAITLSIILLGSVLQIYLSSKQTYRVDDALSRLQEGGRIAMDVLSYDIRLAGYQGCADPARIKTNVLVQALTNAGITDLFPNAVAGVDGNDTPTSDSITVRYGEPTSATAVTAASTSGTIVTASNPAGFTTGDYLLVSDCDTSDVFNATSVTTAAGTTTIAHTAPNNSPATTKIYSTNAWVRRFIANTYFIQDTPRKNARGATIRALVRTNLNNNQTTEIVDGVEYLEVLYGELLPDGNLRYVKANDPNPPIMSQVVSVRLALLLVSDDAVLDADDTHNYQLADVTIKPGTNGQAEYNKSDRRMRRVFTTTVNLRNRRASP